MHGQIADGDRTKQHIKHMSTYKADGVEIEWYTEYEPISRNPSSAMAPVAAITDAKIVDRDAFVDFFGADQLEAFASDPVDWAQEQFGEDLDRLAKETE